MTTPEYDRSLKRPLEIRVRDLSEEGGISEEQAMKYDRQAADALVVMRFLVDGTEIRTDVASLYGATGKPLAPESLFGAWLAYTEFLAKLPVESEADKRRRNFLVHVRKLLNIDNVTNAIQDMEDAFTTLSSEGGPESRCAPEDATAPTSD